MYDSEEACLYLRKKTLLRIKTHVLYDFEQKGWLESFTKRKKNKRLGNFYTKETLDDCAKKLILQKQNNNKGGVFDVDTAQLFNEAFSLMKAKRSGVSFWDSSRIV